MDGVITQLNAVRGRGYIRTRTGQDIPFTKASLGGVTIAQLHSGQAVLFGLQLGFAGPTAVGVHPAVSDPDTLASKSTEHPWSR